MSSRPVSERAVIFLIGRGPVRQHPRLRDGDAAGARLRARARHRLVAHRLHRRQLHGGRERGGLVGGPSWTASTGARRWPSAMLGLVLATAAGGLAHGALHAAAGAGARGPVRRAGHLAVHVHHRDVIPVERRGRALGAVMGAFSVASVRGRPRWPRAGGAAAAGGCPSSRGGAGAAGRARRPSSTCRPPRAPGRRAGAATRVALARAPADRSDVQLSYPMTALVMMGGFIVIPNISAYVQQNLDYPRESVWAASTSSGGIVSFFTLRLVGPRVDRPAPSAWAPWARCWWVLSLLRLRRLPVLAARPAALHGLHAGQRLRNVAYNTLTSRVPSTRCGPGSCRCSPPSATWPRRGRLPVLEDPRWTCRTGSWGAWSTSPCCPS